jgi:hypothetical protein
MRYIALVAALIALSGCGYGQSSEDAANWAGVAATGFGMMQPRPSITCVRYGNMTTCR